MSFGTSNIGLLLMEKNIQQSQKLGIPQSSPGMNIPNTRERTTSLSSPSTSPNVHHVAFSTMSMQLDKPSSNLRVQTLNFLLKYYRETKYVPEVMYLVNLMPKGAALHVNLKGGVNSYHLIELAAKSDVYWDDSTKRFYSKDNAPQSAEAVSMLKKNDLKKKQLGSLLTIDKHKKGEIPFQECLQILDSLCELLDIIDLIKAIRDSLKSQNVKYAEVILSLSEFNRLHNHPKKDQLLLEKDDLKILFLVMVDRAQTNIEAFQQDLSKSIEIQQGHDEVIAVNLGGLENNVYSEDFFYEQREAMLKAQSEIGNEQEKPVKYVINSGELPDGALIKRETYETRMYDSVTMGASRYYSGLCIGHDKQFREVIRKLQNVLLEIPLSVQSLVYGVKSHISTFRLNRVPIALVSSYPGITKTSLFSEYVKAVKKHECTYEELVKIARNSLHHSFLPGESIFDVNEAGGYYPKVAFAELLIDPENWMPTMEARSFLASSQKARMQLSYEIDLCQFEKKILGDSAVQEHYKAAQQESNKKINELYSRSIALRYNISGEQFPEDIDDSDLPFCSMTSADENR